jgi:hypothetical protein
MLEIDIDRIQWSKGTDCMGILGIDRDLSLPAPAEHFSDEVRRFAAPFGPPAAASLSWISQYFQIVMLH